MGLWSWNDSVGSGLRQKQQPSPSLSSAQKIKDLCGAKLSMDSKGVSSIVVTRVVFLRAANTGLKARESIGWDMVEGAGGGQ